MSTQSQQVKPNSQEIRGVGTSHPLSVKNKALIAIAIVIGVLALGSIGVFLGYKYAHNAAMNQWLEKAFHTVGEGFKLYTHKAIHWLGKKDLINGFTIGSFTFAGAMGLILIGLVVHKIKKKNSNHFSRILKDKIELDEIKSSSVSHKKKAAIVGVATVTFLALAILTVVLCYKYAHISSLNRGIDHFLDKMGQGFRSNYGIAMTWLKTKSFTNAVTVGAASLGFVFSLGILGVGIHNRLEQRERFKWPVRLQEEPFINS